MRKSAIRLLTCAGAVTLWAVTGCGGHDASAGQDTTHKSAASDTAHSVAKKDARHSAAKGKKGTKAEGGAGTRADGDHAGAPSGTGSREPAPGSTTVKLDDGRRVAMHYVNGKGLYEQLYTPASGSWSASKSVYATRTEPCQSLKLKAYKGTVAAIANFGVYCSDGEPPTESIAAIGTGNLKTWEHSLTKDFDGWEKVVFADAGRKATFENHSDAGRSYVDWSRKDGFSDPVIAEYPPTPIAKKFLGTWRLEDGSAQVTIEELTPGKGVATFKALGDVRCTAQADLMPSGTDYVDFASDTAVTDGTETENCPPPTETTSFELKGDSTVLHLKNVGVPDPETDLRYVRAQ